MTPWDPRGLEAQELPARSPTPATNKAGLLLTSGSFCPTSLQRSGQGTEAREGPQGSPPAGGACEQSSREEKQPPISIHSEREPGRHAGLWVASGGALGSHLQEGLPGPRCPVPGHTPELS